MSTTSIKTGRPCCQNIPIPYKVNFRTTELLAKSQLSVREFYFHFQDPQPSHLKKYLKRFLLVIRISFKEN